MVAVVAVVGCVLCVSSFPTSERSSPAIVLYCISVAFLSENMPAYDGKKIFQSSFDCEGWEKLNTLSKVQYSAFPHPLEGKQSG